MEHHLWFLLADIKQMQSGEIIFFKRAATELRLLVTGRRSGGNNLLIDIAESMDFEYLFWINRDSPRPPKKVSLKDYLKEETYRVRVGKGDNRRVVTLNVQNLVRKIANQCGSAHEDEGLDVELVNTLTTLVNGKPYCYNWIYQCAINALVVGFRLLENIKRKEKFELSLPWPKDWILQCEEIIQMKLGKK